MGVSLTEYYMQIFDPRTGLTLDDDTGRFTVMTINTATRPTIYSDRFAGTTITNSIGTLTDGVIQFWIAASVTSVDITITTALGQSRFVRGLTPSEHKLSIDQEQRHQTMIIPFNGEAAAAAPFDSLHALVIGALIKDCRVNVITLTASETLDVGITAAAPNDFLEGVDVSAVGMATASPEAIYETGSIESFVQRITRYGDLLLNVDAVSDKGVVGANIAADFGSNPEKGSHYIVTTSETLSYEQQTTNTADGYIILDYLLLPPHL